MIEILIFEDWPHLETESEAGEREMLNRTGGDLLSATNTTWWSKQDKT